MEKLSAYDMATTIFAGTLSDAKGINKECAELIAALVEEVFRLQQEKEDYLTGVVQEYD